MSEHPPDSMTEREALQAVRWRYRICNYLFRLGFTWLGLATVGYLLAGTLHLDETVLSELSEGEIVGLGIVSAAFALTLAIYRCPICDRYLSRFRPRKEFCPSCGAKIWER